MSFLKSYIIAQKVATRKLKAGIIQPPPKMMEKALDFFYGRVAAYVFRIADEYDDYYKVPDIPEFLYEDIGEYQTKDAYSKIQLLLEVFGEKPGIPFMDSNIQTTGQDLTLRVHFEEKRVEVGLGTGDTFKPTVSHPLSFRDGIVTDAIKLAQKHGLRAKKENHEYKTRLKTYNKSDLTPEEKQAGLERNAKLRNLWGKHLGRDSGIDYIVDRDLRGWYYTDQEIGDKVEDYIVLRTRLLPKGFNGSFGGKEHGLDEPTLVIEYSEEIMVWDKSVFFENQLEDLIYHEMQHYAQRLIEGVQGTLDGEFRPYDYKLPHDLLSGEFDAVLTNEVKDYKRFYKKVDPKYRPILFRVWVGLARSLRGEDKKLVTEWLLASPGLPSRFRPGKYDPLLDGREFFKLWKGHDRKAWEKAVKIMSRNVPIK